MEQQDLDEYLNFLTGIPDLDINILNYLNDDDLLHACQTNQYAKNVCRTGQLWQQRSYDRYDNVPPKPKTITWREYYFLLPNYPFDFNKEDYRRYIDSLIDTNNYRDLKTLIKLGEYESVYWEILRLNRLDVLDRLQREGLLEGSEEEKSRMADNAIILGRFNFLDWLTERGIYPSENIMNQAIKHDNLPAVQWLYAHGYPIKPEYLQTREFLRPRRMPESNKVRTWLQEEGLI